MPLKGKQWKNRYTIALVYPNHPPVGMANLGFQTLHQRFNLLENIVCERAFFDIPASATGKASPPSPFVPRSWESKIPLNHFDILAFSIPFENDFINILTLLDLAGIPFKSDNRLPEHPLIIAGGMTSFINPEPIAPFIDLFLLGEGESLIEEFTNTFKTHYGTICKKDLTPFMDIPGVYLPGSYTVTYSGNGTIKTRISHHNAPDTITKRTEKDLDTFITSYPFPKDASEFPDMSIIEINRGCPRGCLFCAAGYLCLPFRNRPLKFIMDFIKDTHPQEKTIGLLGTGVSDYPDLLPLSREILKLGYCLSFSSLRIDRITEDLANILHQSGQKTVTLAPEAGSQRLRNLIKKGITEEQILAAVDTLIRHDILNLKFYFMIGLPGETMDDVHAIPSLVRKVRHTILSHRHATKRLGKLTLTISPYVPKPATPFQWFPLLPLPEIKKRLSWLKKTLSREPNVHVIADLPKWAYIQTLLSRGDRRVSNLLIRVHENGGNWPKSYKESPINPDFFVYRPFLINEPLPWDFISTGIPKSRLEKEYLQACEVIRSF